MSTGFPPVAVTPHHHEDERTKENITRHVIGRVDVGK